MPQEALDRFVEAFKASGFRGGINYYRCLNRNWQMLGCSETLRSWAKGGDF
jgi:hypothetical protein